jgi:hypothetical protein
MPPDSALKAREPVARLPSFSALVALGGVAGKLRLDRIPQRPIDDRRVLARIGLSVVNDLAAIDPVLQYQVERAAGEWLPTRDAARGAGPQLAVDSPGVQLVLHQERGQPMGRPHTGTVERGHQTPRAGRYVAGIGGQLRPQHINHAPRDPRRVT